MRQYRLRTIMALVGVIAVSIWVGMLIERARRPAQGKTIWTYTVTKPVTKTYTVVQPTVKTYTVVEPVFHVSSEEVKP